jgi:hypothetical protein
MVLLRRVQRSSLTLQSRNYSVERNVCPCIPCQPFVLSVSYACTVCKDQGVRLVTSIDLQAVTDFFLKILVPVLNMNNIHMEPTMHEEAHGHNATTITLRLQLPTQYNGILSTLSGVSSVDNLASNYPINHLGMLHIPGSHSPHITSDVSTTYIFLHFFPREKQPLHLMLFFHFRNNQLHII